MRKPSSARGTPGVDQGLRRADQRSEEPRVICAPDTPWGPAVTLSGHQRLVACCVASCPVFAWPTKLSLQQLRKKPLRLVSVRREARKATWLLFTTSANELRSRRRGTRRPEVTLCPHVFNSWLYARDSLSLILEGPLTELCGRAPGKLAWGGGGVSTRRVAVGGTGNVCRASCLSQHWGGEGRCRTSRSSRDSPPPRPNEGFSRPRCHQRPR